MNGFVVLLLLFQLKHFICEFLWQPAWMWQNKGKLFHIGGIAHAALHLLGSAFIFTCMIGIGALSAPIIIVVLALEFFLHYIIDYAKMNISAKKGWKCNTHNEFWVLTGLDQLLHQLTYLLMIQLILWSVQ